MRLTIAAGALASAMMAVGAAKAEQRIFIIANSADGYGVDQCLASGAECGRAAANFYCRSRSFAQALSFRRVGRENITVAIPSDRPNACHGSSCNDFVAIECSR